MMKKLRLTLIIAALSLGATALLPCNAQGAYTPAEVYYAAGSSAQFNTFALAAGLDNAWPGNNALCGENHWTYKNGAELVDPRSGSILPEKGNIWIVWDNNAANEVSGAGVVCYYIAIDSVVGNRTYFANATVTMLVPAGTADAGIVPYLPNNGTTLPTNIYNIVNGSAINVCHTDIRPEDAKFATIRALTSPAGTRILRDHYTGLGYGTTAPPGTGSAAIGTPVYSSQGSGACPGAGCSQANVVDFTINGPDPVTLANVVRPYTVLSVGASPVLVIVNTSNTGNGHTGYYSNINRYALANFLTGAYVHIRQMSNNETTTDALGGTITDNDNPIHVFQREPISGTFNTMEFCIPLAGELYGTYGGPVTIGQETGVNPANTNCTTTPCSVASGNPWWYIAANGATRGRVIGTGQMISTINSTADSLGYAFWGFSNFNAETNTKYLTVDGIDPLYASPSANPGGVGALPQCTGGTLPCPILPFTNVANGGYPIWSVLRIVYDPTYNTTYAPSALIAGAMVNYAQHAAIYTLSDFVPATNLTVFRSHFNQLVVSSNSNDQYPNNGFKSGVPETGGDMGGAVLTVQSELDYINDTGGSQQTNIFQ